MAAKTGRYGDPLTGTPPMPLQVLPVCGGGGVSYLSSLPTTTASPQRCLTAPNSTPSQSAAVALGGSATASPTGSAPFRLRLLKGKLPLLSNGRVAGFETDDLVIVPHRLVRLPRFRYRIARLRRDSMLSGSREMARPKSSTALRGSPSSAWAQSSRVVSSRVAWG